MPSPAPPAEAILRLGCFAGVLVVMSLWERLAPRRELLHPRMRRWRSNLSLVALDTVLLRLALPLGAVAVSEWCRAEGVGLLHGWDVPAAASVPLTVLCLDLAVWAQHVVFHRVPLLWRLHRVHHADPDIDVTTGVRFHPIEILLSMGWKLAVVAALGAPAAGVVTFEVLLNATALFNHGNVRLPEGIDRVLRLLLVTPDMHRVHHSVRPEETNSNYGFNLPWWDRLFRTYRARPALGHERMEIGLREYPGPGPTRLGWMLVNPFT